MRIPSVVAAGIRHVRVVRTSWPLDCWHWAVEKCKASSGFKKWIPFSHLSQILYELEKKSCLVTSALSAKSCTRDTDSLHSCTRLRLVQEMACLYHECKILPRKHSYPNLIPIFMNRLLILSTLLQSASLSCKNWSPSQCKTRIVSLCNHCPRIHLWQFRLYNQPVVSRPVLSDPPKCTCVKRPHLVSPVSSLFKQV